MSVTESAPGKFSENKPIRPVQQLKPLIPSTTYSTRTAIEGAATTVTIAATTATITAAPTITTTVTKTRPAQNIPLLTNPSGQVLRLRGGPGPWEGYVEVQGPGSGWGLVCDKKNSWTIVEATVVCHQLGYER